MAVTTNNQFWKEFIQLYRDLPQLWKVGSDEYKNRSLKTMGYDVLVAKMKMIEPTANREMVRRKINCLRTSYRRELKKIYEKNDDMQMYIPALWYFNDIDFLRDMEIHTSGTENLEEIDSKDNILEVDRDTVLVEAEQVTCTPFQNTMKLKETIEAELVTSTPTQRYLPTKRRLTPELEDRSKRLMDNEHFSVNAENEAEILGKMWALEYMKLIPEQQICTC